MQKVKGGVKQMDNQKKSSTKNEKQPTKLTEERVREIAREEIAKWHNERQIKLPKNPY